MSIQMYLAYVSVDPRVFLKLTIEQGGTKGYTTHGLYMRLTVLDYCCYSFLPSY